jgi:hypothetical protein
MRYGMSYVCSHTGRACAPQNPVMIMLSLMCASWRDAAAPPPQVAAVSLLEQVQCCYREYKLMHNGK